MAALEKSYQRAAKKNKAADEFDLTSIENWPDQEESGLAKDSKGLAEQIRTVSRLRLGRRVGHLSRESLKKLETALRIHLGLG